MHVYMTLYIIIITVLYAGLQCVYFLCSNFVVCILSGKFRSHLQLKEGKVYCHGEV